MAFAKDADPAMKQMPGKTSIDLILPANKLAPIKKNRTSLAKVNMDMKKSQYMPATGCDLAAYTTSEQGCQL